MDCDGVPLGNLDPLHHLLRFCVIRSCHSPLALERRDGAAQFVLEFVPRISSTWHSLPVAALLRNRRELWRNVVRGLDLDVLRDKGVLCTVGVPPRHIPRALLRRPRTKPARRSALPIVRAALLAIP